MSDTLATFAAQVTTVAREVGVEGKLGGQASVPGAAGTWKDLTDNVNQLAANLTTQVRAIAEVATAVTKGDLTRSIKVEAPGEVAALKDNINEMIRNLKDTTLKNSEQDWLKTEPRQVQPHAPGPAGPARRRAADPLGARAGRLGAAGRLLHAGCLDRRRRGSSCSRATPPERQSPGRIRFRSARGSSASARSRSRRCCSTRSPADYLKISSGLGDAAPANIIVLPVLFEGEVKGVLELASFERFNPTHQAFLDQLTESIGIVLNTIEANTRTEDLLKQSQSLAGELQSQQEELRQTNQQLEEKAALLAEQQRRGREARTRRSSRPGSRSRKRRASSR